MVPVESNKDKMTYIKPTTGKLFNHNCCMIDVEIALKVKFPSK